MELSVFAAARECGDHIALIHSDETWTYRALAVQVRCICAGLCARGFDAQTVVALRASNRPQTVMTILALISLGIPFVAIHPRWTDQEVRVVMADAAPAALLDDAQIELLLAYSDSDKFPSEKVIEKTAPLAILYSSGTSGVPKGAILSRAAFVASAQGSAQNLGWQPDDRWLLCLPLCHIGGLSIVVRCLMARKTVVLLPRFEPNAVLFHLKQHRATLASVVPVMLHALLDADRDHVLGSVRAVLCGGAATPLPLVERAQQHGVNVLLTYGLTEACSQVTVQSLADPPLLRTGSGRPIAGMQLEIRTAEGVVCLPGHVGNIWILGSSMMTGYVGKAALGDAWFDTGDIGELSQQGVLTVHARRMDLIITGGENVYPLEVEQALLAYPQVRAVVVFGTPHPQWGATVSAALVVHPDFVFSALWESLCERLAAFKRPRLWAKVLAIPELANGKVDRRRAVAEFTPLLAQSMPQV